MLRGLLAFLVKWAREEHIPMKKGAFQDAGDVLAQSFDTRAHDMPAQAIRAFLKAVKVPVLVLCGAWWLSLILKLRVGSCGWRLIWGSWVVRCSVALG